MKTSTIRGQVEAKWQSDAKRFSFKIRIPANTKARIWLPFPAADSIEEDGKPIDQVRDILPLGPKEGFAGFETGAGEYSFTGICVE
jgi:alpha-L-rhamnosidase